MPWEADVLISADEDFRGLHPLRLVGIDADGDLEIVTGVVETDGSERTPQWCYLDSTSAGWHRQVVLDDNLGTHRAVVADFTDNGLLDIVGKVWRVNPVHGNDG